MSYVTNYILVTSLENADHDFKLPLVAARGLEFKQVDELAGGNKAFEATCALLAVNYLADADVCKAITGIDWTEPESVQLMVKTEDAEVFRLLSWEDIQRIADSA